MRNLYARAQTFLLRTSNLSVQRGEICRMLWRLGKHTKRSGEREFWVLCVCMQGHALVASCVRMAARGPSHTVTEAV